MLQKAGGGTSRVDEQQSLPPALLCCGQMDQPPLCVTWVPATWRPMSGLGGRVTGLSFPQGWRGLQAPEGHWASPGRADSGHHVRVCKMMRKCFHSWCGALGRATPHLFPPELSLPFSSDGTLDPSFYLGSLSSETMEARDSVLPPFCGACSAGAGERSYLAPQAVTFQRRGLHTQEPRRLRGGISKCAPAAGYC